MLNVTESFNCRSSPVQLTLFCRIEELIILAFTVHSSSAAVSGPPGAVLQSIDYFVNLFCSSILLVYYHPSDFMCHA